MEARLGAIPSSSATRPSTIATPASAQLEDGSILTVYYQIDKPGEPTCLMGTHWRLGAGG